MQKKLRSNTLSEASCNKGARTLLAPSDQSLGARLSQPWDICGGSLIERKHLWRIPLAKGEASWPRVRPGKGI